MTDTPLHTEDTTLAKAARLAVLLELDDHGWLEVHAVETIAAALGVTRRTVYRDKKLLAEVRRLRTSVRLRVAGLVPDDELPAPPAA